MTLVAHSMGSGEAVRYLTRHGGGRVARLMLLAPTTPFVLKTPVNPDGVDGELFAQRRDEWRRDFGRWILENEAPYFGDGLPGCDVSAPLREWTMADMLATTLQAAIEFQHSAVETDFRAELSEISVPTLIVQGDAATHLRYRQRGDRRRTWWRRRAGFSRELRLTFQGGFLG